MQRFNKLLPAIGLLIAASAASAVAQSLDDLNIQFHGYATQGFLYTTNNNILTTNSSDGSPAWTEAVVNLSATPKPQLRIAIQARYELLGTLSNGILLDYAVADYRVSEQFGVRFGKVKVPSNLFNEIQDIDPAYTWSLLPQSVYTISDRDGVLTLVGGVGYGSVNLKKAGKLDYAGFGGEVILPGTDGYFLALKDAGILYPDGFSISEVGASLRWRTPLPGLLIGGSFIFRPADTNAVTAGNGALAGSSQTQTYVTPDYFAKYERNKLLLAVEWNRLPLTYQIQFPGPPAPVGRADVRAEYAMATYKVTSKWTAGVYDSQYFNLKVPLGDSRYQKDWAISSRYDFNEFLYAKAEQHFVQGTALNYDTADNAAGIKPNTKFTILKVGVSF